MYIHIYVEFQSELSKKHTGGATLLNTHCILHGLLLSSAVDFCCGFPKQGRRHSETTFLLFEQFDRKKPPSPGGVSFDQIDIGSLSKMDTLLTPVARLNLLPEKVSDSSNFFFSELFLSNFVLLFSFLGLWSGFKNPPILTNIFHKHLNGSLRKRNIKGKFP